MREPFGPRDRRLLEEVGTQVGALVQALVGNRALQRARERLVAAREEERRRLRRDLHDGLGPSLATPLMQLEVARELMAPRPGRGAGLVDQLDRPDRGRHRRGAPAGRRPAPARPRPARAGVRAAAAGRRAQPRGGARLGRRRSLDRGRRRRRARCRRRSRWRRTGSSSRRSPTPCATAAARWCAVTLRRATGCAASSRSATMAPGIADAARHRRRARLDAGPRRGARRDVHASRRRRRRDAGRGPAAADRTEPRDDEEEV